MGTNLDVSQIYSQVDTWAYPTGSPDVYTTPVAARHTVSCSPIVKTPEWRLRHKRHPVWVPPTPYTRQSYQQFFNNGGSVFRFSDGTVRTITGPQYGEFQSEDPADPYGNVLDHYKAVAKNRALGHLSNLKVNWGEAFATRHMTSNMIGDSVLGMVKIALMIRRGQWDKLHRLIGRPSSRKAKTFAELWLQYIYGWYPFVQDIYALSELQNIRDNELQHSYHFSVKGTVREEIRKTDVLNIGQNRIRTTKKHSTVMARCKLWYEMGTAADEFGRTLDQLGIRNPALLAWELMPYSFVLDWVFPIGKWLEAFTADNGLKFISGTVSVHKEHFRYTKETLLAAAPGNSVGYKSYLHDEFNRSSYYNRDPLSSTPGYTVMVKNPFSPTHMTSAIALLSQVLLR